MKFKKKHLIICIAIPMAVGLTASLLTRDYIYIYPEIRKPALSPPGWIFPVVWTILYILMGVSSYLVNTSTHTKSNKKEALGVSRIHLNQIQKANIIYMIQLVFNFFWSIFFFRFHYFFLSFVWLVIMWYFILLMIQYYREISKTAAYLMIPYLLWVTFAGYLNLGIVFLN